jgi:hypothetical protein
MDTLTAVVVVCPVRASRLPGSGEQMKRPWAYRSVRNRLGITLCRPPPIGTAYPRCYWVIDRREERSSRTVPEFDYLLVPRAGASRARRDLEGTPACFGRVFSEAAFTKTKKSFKSGFFGGAVRIWYVSIVAVRCGVLPRTAETKLDRTWILFVAVGGFLGPFRCGTSISPSLSCRRGSITHL